MGKFSTKVVDVNGYVINVECEDYEEFSELLRIMHNEENVNPYVYSQNMHIAPVAKGEGVALDSTYQDENLVAEAEALGGVITQPGLDMGDGTNFLGQKNLKAKATSVKDGDSYLIGASSYSYDPPTFNADKTVAKPAEIRFYNKHGKYPACTHNFAGKGEAIFQQVFGDWQPEVGSKVPMPNGGVWLYIVCSGKTDHGNPYQNLRGKKEIG